MTTSISKIYKKCNKCKHKDNCDNKRMVACNLAEISKSNMKNNTFSNDIPCNQSITINCKVSKDDVEKAINMLKNNRRILGGVIDESLCNRKRCN